MKQTTVSMVSCVLVLLVASPTFGQGMTGSIRVTAQAPDGGILEGATVTAASPEALGRRTAVSDERGAVTFAGLDPSAAYVVTVALDGFNTARFENTLVKAGQTTTLRAQLTLAPVRADIEVVAESPIIDLTSAISGQDITLQLTESLPTGRTYQSYLQLVPGVLPTDPSRAQENPAVRSGLNFDAWGRGIGRSRDNFYYIEGIDVTDPYTGYAGADVNTEIIQEQSVMTGGIPAEFVGAPGLVSSVITKSGGNNFHGSVNYFFQHDGLVADNEHAEAADFSTYDAAFTLGGPIVRDKAWFFASFRRLHREEDVSSLETGEYMRTVNTDADQGFLKLSWNPIPSIKLTGTFMTDPTTTDGQVLRDVTNGRDRTKETGGARYILDYSQIIGPLYLSVSGGKHNGEESRYAANQDIRNNVIFNVEDKETFTLEEELLGGDGTNLLDERDNEFLRGSLEWYAGAGWGDHTITFGAERLEHINMWDARFTGGARYTSIHPRYAGVTAYQLRHGSFTGVGWIYDLVAEYVGLVNSINASPNAPLHYSILDLDSNGVITPEELANALVFDSTAGNPHGMVNNVRTVESNVGPVTLRAKGTSFYVQDTFQRNRLTVNAGVRAEEWQHFATTGENIYTFDWMLAPRLGVIYDITGTGRQKISAFYGRYHDPIRMNMTDFAGTLSGRVIDNQVYVNGEWLTFLSFGYTAAVFSPTTKTPYTDDLQLGYQIDLGRNMSFEALLISRRTRDILEDYDLCLYAYCTDGTTYYPGPIDHPDSLWLGLDYFGYDRNPGTNFVISTLAGGWRDWQGVELVFRKRYSDNWQMLASYSHADAEGNSNSDSNAAFPGDVLWVDPRAPNATRRLPGLIEHLFKVAASYEWNNGIQVGAVFRWNSGTVANKVWRWDAYPVPADEPFEYAGMTTSWLAPDALGSISHDAWGTLDLRAKYSRDFGAVTGEFFIDIFNALDDQAAIQNEASVIGSSLADFGEPIAWVPPRRFYLGARLSF